jgi:hypothetical protein
MGFYSGCRLRGQQTLEVVLYAPCRDVGFLPLPGFPGREPAPGPLGHGLRHWSPVEDFLPEGWSGPELRKMAQVREEEPPSFDLASALDTDVQMFLYQSSLPGGKLLVQKLLDPFGGQMSHSTVQYHDVLHPMPCRSPLRGPTP